MARVYTEAQKKIKRARAIAWNKANPERRSVITQAWNKANREYFRVRAKTYRKANLEKCRARSRVWEKTNLEKKRAGTRVWRKLNQEKIRVWNRTYRRQKYATNSNFRIYAGLRRIMARVRKLTPWPVKLREMLGCDQDWFRAWMEIQFKPGMSWENQSQWHIDHIRPISSFDLNDLRQLRKVNHFTNLQPLWAEENMRKHAKWDRGTAGLSSGEQ